MKKRSIFRLLTVLVLWIVVSRFAELGPLRVTIARAQWSWLLAAVPTLLGYLIAFAASYQAAFRTLDVRFRIREIFPLTLGASFVNLVVPTGIAGGTALFAPEVVRRGKPAATASTGLMLQQMAHVMSFSIILVPAMFYLYLEHDLRVSEILGAAILLLIVVGLSAILLLETWKQGTLRGILNWWQQAANRAVSRSHVASPLAEDWAEKNAEGFRQAASAVRSRPVGLIRTIAIALLAHGLDIGTLYLVFRSFHESIALGPLVAGYAVGILFWIIAITPQGIGIVEGMMALAFTSLGIPGAVSATVVLVFRGLTFWLPAVLGFTAVQQMRLVGPRERTLTETWGVRIAAILVALMGIVNVLSAVTPSLASRLRMLEQFSPLEVRHGGHLTAALAGFALLLVARSLWRRKRVAWVIALAALAISAVSHMIKGLDYEEALIAIALTVMLWLMRSHFHARSDRPSLQQGISVLLGAMLFTLAYGVTGFFLLDRHYTVHFGFWAALRQTVIMFTQFYDPGLNPVTRFGRFFADSIYTVGAVTIGYAGVMLLRPVVVREPATESERKRARDIVEGFGHTSLARAVLFDDKRYLFPSGSSVIGYALAGGTAVALGDPIGPDRDLRASIEAFSALCLHNDWLPVFYQTQPATLEAYKRAGFEAIRIGEEGIVNLSEFSLEGKEGKPLRSPFNKLTNAGHRFVVHQPPIPEPFLEELRAISDEWLTFMHGSEMRFSLGWFDDDYIRNSAIAAVHAPEGWVNAFANLVPEYQVSEITVDLMRHRHAIENGTMEFLFVSMFQWARAQGYHRFNLGLSSLSGVGQESDDPAIERVMHWIYEHVNQFYNFKGLHAFKEKFHPEWSPRYLIYSGPANLAQAWLAVVRVNAGGGVIPPWLLKKRGYPRPQPEAAHEGARSPR